MHTRWASLVLALFLNVVLWSGGGVGRNLPAARTSTGTEPRPSLPLPPWLNTPEEAAAAAAAAVGGSIGRQGPPGDDNSTAEAAPRQPPPPWLADEPEEERAEGGGRGRRGLPSYKFPSKLGKAAERPPRYVFRGVHEDLPPERVMQQGGLLPNVADPRTLSPNSYQLLYHLEDGHGEESAYVSTSTSFEVAASYARPGGYVYVVKTTPNMVPIEYSIDRYFTRWEREYAALGGLQDGQIVDCLQMPAAGADWDVEELVPFFWDEGEDVSLNTLQPKRLLKDGLVEARREHLRYDHVRFEPMSASPGQPQLAGFAPTSGLWNKAALKRFDRHRPAWQHARDFMEAIGTPDGWSPRFPLFHCWWQEAGAERDNDVAAGELAGSSRISWPP
ncbi:putative enterotoxin [Cordyceps sp. RAO-2017]|nr:putative enterotoxin [Cordyceps sp. RAO-2017]